MNTAQPQVMLIAAAVALFVLWQKGYLDSILSQVGFTAVATGQSVSEPLLAAVQKTIAEAELKAQQEIAERMRSQIHDVVKANFGAAGTSTQAPSSPASPA